MGKLVSSTIPNLISGVSQQPWNVRLPTQAEEQVNCQSSVTDFLKRRPATRHLARIRDTPAANGIASHHINRDETEQYIVTADASGINVFDPPKPFPSREREPPISQRRPPPTGTCVS